jgi:hypothetical protein
MNQLIITNDQVLSFYKENPSIDVNAINLVFIDILKQLSTNLSKTIDTALSSQILNIVSDIKTEVNQLNSSFIIKMHSIKKEFMDDIKLVLLNSEHNNQAIINNSTENLVTKFKEIIPKSQESSIKQIEECIRTHCNIIGETTTKILQSREHENKPTQDKEIINDIEKYVSNIISSLQTTIFSYIQNSDTKIQQISDNMMIQKQVQDTLNTELTTFLNKYKCNSSVKGAISEIELYNILQKIVPSDEIIRCSSQSNTCDFRVNRRNRHLPTILFENKDYTSSVNSEEVAKFERDLQLQNCHGIFISQNSPITFKQNFHIDIINGLIHFYIPNANYDADKIKLAIDVIDNLSERLSQINNTEDGCVKFSQDDFDSLKDEYKKFVIKKVEMIEMIRTITKQLLDKMEEIQLPVFKRVTGNNENSGMGILCISCNNFWAKNKASLSAHMKKCRQTLIVET